MEITDLPLDVLMLIFSHLPLMEVLKRISLVNRSFYRAHIAFCRSSVKQITLIGHYMGKETRSTEPPVLRTEDQIHEYFFTLARRQPSVDVSFLNPRISQLYLSAEFEASAYSAISKKFFCVSHLELFEVRLERHYNDIVKMLESRLARALVELKLFVSRERYTAAGVKVSPRNNSPAIDRILEVLNSENAPALRRLVLLPGVNGDYERLHDSYRNNKLELDLSRLETLTLDRSFSKILAHQLMFPERFESLKRMTLFVDHYMNPLVKQMIALNELAVNPHTKEQSSIFAQLTHLTLNSRRFYTNMDVFRLIVVQCAPRGNSSLKYLALNGSFVKSMAPITFYLAPLASSLQHLRVEYEANSRNKQNEHFNEQLMPQDIHPGRYNLPPMPAKGAIFSKLTTLHLVHSKLLHSLGSGIPVILKTHFPNVEHLILEGTFTESPQKWALSEDVANFARLGRLYHRMYRTPDNDIAYEPICQECARFIGGRKAENLQLKESTTADVCKTLLVQEAVKAWPKSLKFISLSIEDFIEAKPTGHEWKYTHLFETLDCTEIVASAAASSTSTSDRTCVCAGNVMAQKWKVQKIAY